MKQVLNLLILAFFFLLFSIPAYAYLDPGSGSFILQMLIGAVLGGLVTLKMYFHKVKNFFKKSPTKIKDISNDDNQPRK